MALTLIKEDGTGRTDANSYATAADGDAYHSGHLYATAWTGATLSSKEAALVMATRLIDMSYQFSGWKKASTQALQWPREGAVDPDRRDVRLSILEGRNGPYFDNDSVPGAVMNATCEMAREMLIADRTGAPAGEGIAKVANSLTGDSTQYDKTDRRPIISHAAQAMLRKLGNLLGARTGIATLVRT